MRFFQREECVVAAFDGRREIGAVLEEVQHDLVGEPARDCGTAKVPHRFEAIQGGLPIPEISDF